MANFNNRDTDKPVHEMLEHKEDHHVVHEANKERLAEAVAAEDQEHMGVVAAFRLFPKAAFWSMVMSMVIVMEAYDAALVSNLMAQPAFQRHFGQPLGDGTYQVPPAWQSACNYASTIGAFVGILICGYVQPHLGYKKTMIGALVAMTCFIFVTFFAETLPVLFVGQFLAGLPWGFYNAIAQAYASEIVPLPLRAHATMWNQVCWCVGQLMTSGILFGFRNGTSKWSYKIPFAIQWIWPVPLIIAMIFAPESPWWLVRKNRLEDAEKVVRRLESKNSPRDPAAVVAMMARTIEIENSLTEGASLAACLKGIDGKRTLVASFMFAAQNWSGLLIGNMATYFYTVAGMGADKAFGLGLGTSGVQLAAVLVAFHLVTRVGRRRLYLSGVAFQTAMLLAIGIAAAASKSSTSFWIQATFLMLVYASYGLSVGPITFTIVAEVSSIKLRAQTCAIARAAYYAVAVPMGFVQSYSLNPLAWDLQGRSAFIWFGTAVGVLIFVYFMVPETKDRTVRELDILWHRRVPPRKFKTTVIDKDDDE
ncbi:hypothetical protein CcaverHIS002_0211930 [Cutaneotrichosporon cavernicola]|uniref:Major facilitator superfamily (MFS) profile domain-containing protein n=1 Tax=Cutaneotrichosporon cavernicola TaxID=279322 RepID=A0AA48IG88_9TREE|nr:uncharacterized protein CcaverHIS019_0211950 [Cutaneotrichosporon cavernicola]BEI82033.1 hypothetical protein CcaverHIS002_0211930 [Cutaneotrichosporon cavernicola]BEI89833.1 hypothetical protein CcaverHIS019_0211950 [Cutaneotrichosporon cavernicola]BEI97603.1 hypothetical protein CcaverHIS631_0211920 [Cutaneotrichosporon cavernicola]BEJ05382.1 hypothetical protein CcaverHIS641_0211990 [Cutaneotrichosporon cavernicola]